MGARLISLRRRKKGETEGREGTITIPEVIEFNQLEKRNQLYVYQVE